MMELAGLNEISINEPVPRFQTNEQLAEYLKSHNMYREKLINTIFTSPDFHHSDDPSWDDVLQGWLHRPIEIVEETGKNEIAINDGDDNIIYISITLMGDDPTIQASFEVSLPPNKFYCEYY